MSGPATDTVLAEGADGSEGVGEVDLMSHKEEHGNNDRLQGSEKAVI